MDIQEFVLQTLKSETARRAMVQLFEQTKAEDDFLLAVESVKTQLGTHPGVYRVQDYDCAKSFLTRQNNETFYISLRQTDPGIMLSVLHMEFKDSRWTPSHDFHMEKHIFGVQEMSKDITECVRQAIQLHQY